MDLFGREKAILITLGLPKKTKKEIEDSFYELEQLTLTAGAQIVGKLRQFRQKPDLKYFIGKGKLEELKALVAKTSADSIIIDADISPAEQRNLEKALGGAKVIDRTGLILDIFAQHAHSREGALQVELAQLEYTLPRLKGLWPHLSRPGGGIGTRGPGEKQIEVDRRRIQHRISLLKEDVEKVRRERHLRRQKRKSTQIAVASIVGYTNAGKSTLLNCLSGAHVLVEDRLFATLDPTTRRVYLPNKKIILATDTVGFIQNLPHQLIDAFRATLEEVTEADILLHIVDITHPNFEEQISAVYKILEELGAVTKPIITVFNKIDELKKKRVLTKKILKKFAPAAAISALKQNGLEDLLKKIAEVLG